MTGEELSGLIFQLRCLCISRDESIRSECSLSPVEFRALSSFSGSDKLSASEFAEMLDLSPSRVSRVIDRMVSGGLITVQTNPSDRRGVAISLTPAGEEQRLQIEAARKNCNDKIETVLTETERSLIGESLNKLINSLK